MPLIRIGNLVIDFNHSISFQQREASKVPAAKASIFEPLSCRVLLVDRSVSMNYTISKLIDYDVLHIKLMNKNVKAYKAATHR
uniref:Putative ovule protein n=1 Tax=Solanum chacoense TaxID=4108 RepID=A0A0V0HP87_SOLCH